jgi:cytidylate kinase
MQNMPGFLKAYGSILAREREALGDKQFRPPIALSREIGSGGRLIAQALADRLGFTMAGKSILEEIANKTKVPQDLVEMLDERPGRALEIFGAGLLRGAAINEGDYDRVLKSTLSALLELGSVVIVGRGAVFVAKPGRALRVLVVAPLEQRIENYARYLGLDLKKAREDVARIDDERHRFHKRHFGTTDVTPDRYDIAINTGHISILSATDILTKVYEEVCSRAEVGSSES